MRQRILVTSTLLYRRAVEQYFVVKCDNILCPDILYKTEKLKFNTDCQEVCKRHVSLVDKDFSAT